MPKSSSIGAVRILGLAAVAFVLVLAGCAQRTPVAAASSAPVAESAPAKPAVASAAAAPAATPPVAVAMQGAPEQTAPDWAAQRAVVARDRSLVATSPLARPAPFDAEAYRRDPRPYLAETAASRLWQRADPREGGPELGVAGAVPAAGRSVASGGSTDLAVEVPAGWPATFVSMDRGLFQNGLNVITVQSDGSGRATAVFTADPGTTDLVRVAAASPVMVGQVDFQIRIVSP